MNIDKDNVRKRVEAMTSVPTLPGVFEKVSRLIGRSEATAEDIAKVISSDQALSAKILRIVNSAFYGFPNRISSVTHALIILGFDVVKGLMLSTSVFDIMIARGFDGLWAHSLGSALTAGIIARKINVPNPEEVSLAGLLHDIGKVIVKIELPEESSLIDEVAAKEEILAYEAEADILGFDHTTVGKWLCQKWNLPDKLADPITYHNTPLHSKRAPTPTAIIHVADALVRGIGFGFAGDHLVPQIDSGAWTMLDISDALLEEIIEEMGNKLEDAEVFLCGDDLEIS